MIRRILKLLCPGWRNTMTLSKTQLETNNHYFSDVVDFNELLQKLSFFVLSWRNGKIFFGTKFVAICLWYDEVVVSYEDWFINTLGPYQAILNQLDSSCLFDLITQRGSIRTSILNDNLVRGIINKALFVLNLFKVKKIYFIFQLKLDHCVMHAFSMWLS